MPKSKQNTTAGVDTTESLERLQRENRELVSLNRSKDEFVAIASHQLRTPATAVKQYLALLLEGYAEPLSESQREFIIKAFESNERQLRIVDDILRISQLDLDKIRMSPVHADLAKIVDEAVAAVSNTAAKRGQEIKVIKPKEAVIANVDANLMRMVLENLLENALNYSYANSEIRITTWVQKDHEARIAIKDKGVGIATKDQPKLFEKFSRIPNPLSVESGGTGLGLYWAQKMVSLHGGRISLTSTLGKGSEFVIRLPL